MQEQITVYLPWFGMLVTNLKDNNLWISAVLDRIQQCNKLLQCCAVFNYCSSTHCVTLGCVIHCVHVLVRSLKDETGIFTLSAKIWASSCVAAGCGRKRHSQNGHALLTINGKIWIFAPALDLNAALAIIRWRQTILVSFTKFVQEQPHGVLWGTVWSCWRIRANLWLPGHASHWDT